MEDFLSRYPEFAEAGEGRLQAALDEAVTRVSEDWIVDHVGQAILAMAAHLLYVEAAMMYEISVSLTGRQVSAGPITSETVGPLSVQYADLSRVIGSPSSLGSSGTNSLEESPYGRRFLELARISFPSVMVVI